MCLFLKLWLNEQRHGSIPDDFQRPLPFSDNLVGTRRSSTSFLDTLQRRTDLHNLLERLHHQTYSCPKPEESSRDEMNQSLSTSDLSRCSSFTNDDQAPNNVPKDTGASEYSSQHVKMNSPSHTMSFSRRNSDAHPHYCQACMAMLLAVRSGGRGSLGHASSQSSSHFHQNMPSVSSLKPSFSPVLANRDSSSPIYMTPQSPYISTLPAKQSSVLENISIPVQVTPPSPVHKSHSPAQIPVTSLPNSMSPLNPTIAISPVYISIPSPVYTSPRHMSMSSPVHSNYPLKSSSPVSPISSIGPHSHSLGDSSDLSHLDRCLHHIINRRTSTPVLTDKTQPGDGHSDACVNRFRVPQFQSVSSLCLPVSHLEQGSFSVLDSEVGPGLVVGEKAYVLVMILAEKSRTRESLPPHPSFYTFFKKKKCCFLNTVCCLSHKCQSLLVLRLCKFCRPTLCFISENKLNFLKSLLFSKK